MNKEQIIEAVGQEYTKWFYDNAIPSVSGKPILNGEGILTRGEFINRCKTDTEFSEKWGLKITERELSEEERWRIRFDYYPKDKQFPWDRMALPSHRFLDDFNIPTKLITITYNDKTIESYE